MGHLLSVLFHGLRRNLLLFASIVLILLAGGWVRGGWHDMQRLVGELPVLRQSDKDVRDSQALLVARTVRQARRAASAGVGEIEATISRIDGTLFALRREQEYASRWSTLIDSKDSAPDQVVQATRRAIEIAALSDLRDYLVDARNRATTLLHRQAALQKLEQLRLASQHAHAALAHMAQQQAARDALTKFSAHFAFTQAYDDVQRLAMLTAANLNAYDAFKAQQALVNQLPSWSAPGAFELNQQRLAAAAAPLRERLVQAEHLAAQHYAWRAFNAVRPVLPVALGVLLCAWLVPAAIRALFYFVCAPLASRLEPIIIGMPNRTPMFSTTTTPLRSAVSQQLTLAPDQEMLIHPSYCQSQPVGVMVTTKLLFDWRHWLPSVASHMWMLKRLRTTQPAGIIVSSTLDALEEVALLHIAEGEAFVLQARGLAGIVYTAGRRPRIRSHWRLGTLHAWLTLQLRYLAFEGPATLIVKGCRGVRLEHAGDGRTISQDATLGFSANTVYATVRAEPFIPYLRGRQALLHDRFSGNQAYYLYEEVPRNARPGERSRNPFEVLIDAGLKAFGI